MEKVVNIISLGCAKNLVDSEILLGGLHKSNVAVTDNPVSYTHLTLPTNREV